MNPTPKMLTVEAVMADDPAPYCRCWGLAVVLGSLASWAAVIAAARLIVAAV
jgi:hypothetical protein